MAFVSKSKKKLRRKILMIVGVVVTICIVAAVGIFTYTTKIRSEYESEIISLKTEKANKTLTLYVAKGFIKAGDLITEENVYKQEVFTDYTYDYYINSDDIGKMALIDIPNETAIASNMVTKEELTNDVRELEFNTISLMTNQEESDFVDVRIVFPTGEDYVVLSKKKVRDLSLIANSFYMWLNEEEIIRMASATVDAYINGKAKIYTVRYVESNLQEETIPNYPVNLACIELINKDPNIYTKAEETLSKLARIDLEERLAALSVDTVGAVKSGQDREAEEKAKIINELAWELGLVNEIEAKEAEETSEEDAINDLTGLSNEGVREGVSN